MNEPRQDAMSDRFNATPTEREDNAMSSSVATKKTYSESDIKVLEGLEPVRERPGMYIGTVDKQGLHHLVWEILDNAVDEYLNGHADTITVTLHKKGDSVTVSDNGRGIPVGRHPKYKKPTLELILCTLHAGGKFGEKNSYVYSGGLHGVGSSVVMALSRKLVATIRRDGFEWQQSFGRGKATSELKKLAPTRGHGTTISFEPDPDIFRSTELDAELIRERLADMSYIHSGLKIIFKNEAAGEEPVTLEHPGGIPEFLGHLVAAAGKPTVPPQPAENGGPRPETAFLHSRKEGDRIEVALQWTEATDEDVRSYVNGIRTSGGGTHETGFKVGIAKAIRNYINTHDVKIKGLDITADDIREGIVGVLSVFVREPMFQGQTKDKLNNPELTALVDNFVRIALEAWLSRNPTAADQIVGRIVLAARARLASREAVLEIKRKSVTQRRLNLPGKLADCKATAQEDTELFIVEGDSAGGSAKQGRNNLTQAVLPLRGKILNSEGLSLAKALTNAELSDLVSAIGTGAGEKFNLDNLRYGKIILLMDADADGMHISTLLLAFFFRHLPELIRQGRVFLAQPPLYRIDVGKETFWARDDAHKEQILAGLRKGAKPEVSRFKGLGEMDPKVLAATTLDPRNRTLLKVQIDSLLETDRTFAELLGKESAQRQRLVLERAPEIAPDEVDV
jgi:DNA gyrase/topoisomerase IV subunit B